MSYLEEYYLKKEEDTRLAEIKRQIKQYNDEIDIIKEHQENLIPKIIEEIQKNPPKYYVWVLIDGKKTLSWSIAQDSEERQAHQSINLLQDGSLILTTYETGTWVSQGDVSFEHIINTGEDIETEYYWYNGKCTRERIGYYSVNRIRSALENFASLSC